MEFLMKTRQGKVLVNNDILKTNVPDLTTEQLEKLGVLLTNGLSEKIRDIHLGYDSVLGDAFGVQRTDADAKSYEFWPQQANALKGKVENAGGELKKQLEALQAEKTELESKLKSGAKDETLKTQLTEKDRIIEQLRGDIQKVESEWKGKYDAEIQRNNSSFIVNQQNAIRAGLTFSSKYNKNEVDLAWDAAIMRAEKKWDIEREGDNVLVKKDGQIATNPNNGRRPYTYEEVILMEFEKTDYVDRGQQQTGAGTKPPQKTGDVSSPQRVVLSTPNSRDDFTRQFQQEARKVGLVAGSEAYNKARQAAMEEYGYNDLAVPK